MRRRISALGHRGSMPSDPPGHRGYSGAQPHKMSNSMPLLRHILLHLFSYFVCERDIIPVHAVECQQQVNICAERTHL